MTGSKEFRAHWRPLLGASLGMGSALSLHTYVLSIFAPYMIAEFGWSRSQWAMLGLVQIVVFVSIPVAGRLTDIFGVRSVAAVGAFSYPLFLVALATLHGGIGTYLAIYIAQTLICSTTTATVYSRVIATNFTLARGLALGLAGSAPPLIGAVASPLLSAIVAANGWRVGYGVLALFCMACAGLTFYLLKSHDDQLPAARDVQAPLRRPRGDYRRILGMPVFWIMFVALFLVNLPFALAASQLKLVVLDQGLSDTIAASMVSVFAVASIVGRVLSGLALDRYAPHAIAGFAFALPVIGLLLLASSYNSPMVILIAIGLIGLSFGGEGDVIPYLVSRFFEQNIYSTVLGLLTAAMGSAMALGNVLIAAALANTDSFDVFFLIAATASLAGSAMFWLLALPSIRPTRVERLPV